MKCIFFKWWDQCGIDLHCSVCIKLWSGTSVALFKSAPKQCFLAVWDNKLFTWCACTHFSHMSLFLLPTQLSAGSGWKPLQDVTAWNSNSPLGGVNAWVKQHNKAHTEHPPHWSLIASPTTRWLTAQCTYLHNISNELNSKEHIFF